MSDVEEHGETSTILPADVIHDDMGDDALHVSSLRPTPRAFSMRRLLNGASLAVAAFVVLAMGIVWLPGILPQRANSHNPQPKQAPGQSNNGQPSPGRGAGWKPIGPNWAQSVVFAANAQVGYVCGALGRGNAPVLVARFDASAVSKNTWKSFTNPTTGSNCQVSVSPVDAADVALVANRCEPADCTYGASHVFRSHDGGVTWSALRLPAAQSITDIAWTNSATLFLVATSFTPGSTTPPTFSLLVSRVNEPLIPMSATLLTGHTAQFGPIGLVSSGATVYASLSGRECLNYCTILVRSADEGRTWTQLPATYRNAPLVPEAAQANTATLVGWIFDPKAGALVVTRSDDNGASWRTLPPLPTNPATGGAALFMAPDGAIYAFCFGAASQVYALGAGARAWRPVAPLPTGIPLAVQYDAAGHAVALWGQAINPTAALGLEYYPLAGNAP